VRRWEASPRAFIEEIPEILLLLHARLNYPSYRLHPAFEVGDVGRGPANLTDRHPRRPSHRRECHLACILKLSELDNNSARDHTVSTAQDFLVIKILLHVLFTYPTKMSRSSCRLIFSLRSSRIFSLILSSNYNTLNVIVNTSMQAASARFYLQGCSLAIIGSINQNASSLELLAIHPRIQ
jgi:hypothetical protein